MKNERKQWIKRNEKRWIRTMWSQKKRETLKILKTFKHFIQFQDFLIRIQWMMDLKQDVLLSDCNISSLTVATAILLALSHSPSLSLSLSLLALEKFISLNQFEIIFFSNNFTITFKVYFLISDFFSNIIKQIQNNIFNYVVGKKKRERMI